MSSSPLPGLYIVATPIGNLGDLSDRARAILSAADVVACEDTRVTGKLLHLSGIKRPLLRHDDHADDRARAALIERMGSQVVVLVSDAGTPLISDPGYRLVRDARAAGRMVTSIPGACAAVTALTMAGLPTDRFLFAGFLPAKAGARAGVIAELAAVPATLVFYESGPRLPTALLALAEGLGDREAAVCRELTKLHEECVTGTLSSLASHYATPPKGEIVIVIAPPGAPVIEEASEESIDAALIAALADAPAAKAAKAVAKQLGIAREAAYARAIELASKR
ncbi:16S rRNA (cytidine(1402)-2'-O)-methyltransferase [Sphingomonas lacunae]|uniref:Ribosomal RNA small subunit methyltransferase I n=1 Tax=Sphingomonas lacunae TaxID=2698828 RepID=A0A6M4AVJ1_9SPHN|nr:16S rRNA (cytidine(1402)-2'-O)-methyltransferase [Sphingomonas lacunae]QJQ32420.1 16S rRNA (cytidine(1402)-2'-O)-methyltransferase [Sphingomonas lacunae]